MLLSSLYHSRGFILTASSVLEKVSSIEWGRVTASQITLFQHEWMGSECRADDGVMKQGDLHGPLLLSPWARAETSLQGLRGQGGVHSD